MADSAVNTEEEVDPKDVRNLATLKKGLFIFMILVFVGAIGFAVVQSI